MIADPYQRRVEVVPGKTGTFYGRAMTAGHIYSVAGNGGTGLGGTGVPATKTALTRPEGVAVDAAGNLVIADAGRCRRRPMRVRVVAAATGTFYGQTMTAGDIYTIAGPRGTGGIRVTAGPATNAVLELPRGPHRRRLRSLIIADAATGGYGWWRPSTGTSYGQQMTAGDIYTVAGSGGVGFCCDGAPATTAQMIGPFAVATDAAGNTVIADSDNNRIRVVAARTGTFYGQAMTKGDIYTVAGDGKRGQGGPTGFQSQGDIPLSRRRPPGGPWEPNRPASPAAHAAVRGR